MFSSQEIGSGLVSFQMIFEALQSELVRFDFHFLRSKLQKIPEFNLNIEQNSVFKSVDSNESGGHIRPST